MQRTLELITTHPLTRDRPLSAVMRFVNWQLRSRLLPEVEFAWVSGAKLVVRRGMTGATGNIYCGLHEFCDMAFLLHLLRPGDLFVDIGANIGSYMTLASSVCGARSIAFEPDPETAMSLRRNVEVNHINDLVRVIEAALGPEDGEVTFSVGRDTTNQVVDQNAANSRLVAQIKMDSALENEAPTFMKLDVEGYEEQVLSGAARTLKSNSLIALATEFLSSDVKERLSAEGFTQMFYDPFKRSLMGTPGEYKASNALFIRDVKQCKARISNAPKISVLGHLF